MGVIVGLVKAAVALILGTLIVLAVLGISAILSVVAAIFGVFFIIAIVAFFIWMGITSDPEDPPSNP